MIILEGELHDKRLQQTFTKGMLPSSAWDAARAPYATPKGYTFETRYYKGMRLMPCPMCYRGYAETSSLWPRLTEALLTRADSASPAHYTPEALPPPSHL